MFGVGFTAFGVGPGEGEGRGEISGVMGATRHSIVSLAAVVSTPLVQLKRTEGSTAVV